jgi:hypothetical protein
MTSSFRAYIDESGDEGFRFRRSLSEQASTDWFVLGGLVTRKAKDLETVRVVDHVREEFQMPRKKHIHWKDLKHPQKVRYAQMISTLQARAVGICVHKPSLREPETFREEYRLYFLAVRYLMERISWLARDRHDPDRWGGDGTVEVVFSNRSGMPYDKMKEYLHRLERQQESGADVRIKFEAFCLDKIQVQTPGRSMGLQLADAVAGAFFNALEQDRFGNTEPRCLQVVLPIVYRDHGACVGHGIKIVPREATEELRRKAHLGWLTELK